MYNLNLWSIVTILRFTQPLVCYRLLCATGNLASSQIINDIEISDKWGLIKIDQRFQTRRQLGSDHTCWLGLLGWAISLRSTPSRFWNQAVMKIPSKCKDVWDSVEAWCENSLAAPPLPSFISRDSGETQKHLLSRIVYFHVTHCAVEWKQCPSVALVVKIRVLLLF